MANHSEIRPRGKFYSIISSVFVLVLLATFLVESGAWDTFVQVTGFGNEVHSADGLKPEDEDRKSNDLSIKIPSGIIPHLGERGNGNEAEAQNGHLGSQEGSKGVLAAAAQSPVPIEQALSDARSLPVAVARPEGYSRINHFGTWIHSSSLCGSGTTRDFILSRDMSDVIMSDKCKVMSGIFMDPYTGSQMRFKYGRDTSSDVQIDHVVALKDAWASGLYKASQETRVAYANDPFVLLASSGSQNIAKSDGLKYSAKSDPIWLPPNRSWHCDYVAKRTEIKKRYELTVTLAEKNQSVRLLEACTVGTYK